MSYFFFLTPNFNNRDAIIVLFWLILDINECESNPCGKNAECKDSVGSFVCSCKEDYAGDPYRGCEGEQH